jgi:hypothetical protein
MKFTRNNYDFTVIKTNNDINVSATNIDFDLTWIGSIFISPPISNNKLKKIFKDVNINIDYPNLNNKLDDEELIIEICLDNVYFLVCKFDKNININSKLNYITDNLNNKIEDQENKINELKYNVRVIDRSYLILYFLIAYLFLCLLGNLYSRDQIKENIKKLNFQIDLVNYDLYSKIDNLYSKLDFKFNNLDFKFNNFDFKFNEDDDYLFY